MHPSYSFNPLATYLEAAVSAAFGIFLFGGIVPEQQIDMVKEAISRYREAEIEQSSLGQVEKEEAKRQWKLWLETYTKGVKDEVRREGRLV